MKICLCRLLTDFDLRVGLADAGDESVISLRQTLREAALAPPVSSPEVPNERIQHHTPAEHYFTPIVQPSNNKIFEDKKVDVVFGKQKSYNNSLIPNRSLISHPSMDLSWSATEDLKGTPNNLDSTKETERPSSPPLLMDLSTFGDSYDDLLGTTIPPFSAIMLGVSAYFPVYLSRNNNAKWCFSSFIIQLD